MTEYATAEDKCRSRMLLRYFGEKNEHNCGLCDVCLSKHHSGMKLGEFQEMEIKSANSSKHLPSLPPLC